MNPDLERLQPYPFQKLARLFSDVTPPTQLAPIRLSIGEPQDPPPALVADVMCAQLAGLGRYPVSKGEPDLRQAITAWLTQRFTLPAGAVDPERHVLPVSGTREALFAFAQAVVDRQRPGARVAMPNPFYQIYEGAALLAGAEPLFLNCTAETGFVPAFEQVTAAQWARCQLLYLCSPGNPSGAVIDETTLARVIELAERHDFIIAADECYSEIYQDEAAPPAGLLGAAARIGNTEFHRCVVFHSLSKRSNVPGLRSGFVAGDARVLERFLLYRTYHGCALPPPTQAVSAALWRDDVHARASRARYRERFAQVRTVLDGVLPLEVPPAGFYLWPRLPVDGETFARRLYGERNVIVLPGSYLSRDTDAGNPGREYVRIALVAPLEACVEAAERIRDTLIHLPQN
ncbi:MAG: succinyldiaminopimelate transaminase [Thiotrichales bacterium]